MPKTLAHPADIAPDHDMTAFLVSLDRAMAALEALSRRDLTPVPS